MKPNVKINQASIDQKNLCRILIDARTAMIAHAVYKAQQGRATIDEMKKAGAEADRSALSMATRVMRVKNFDEGLLIVKEYVDIKIV